MNNFLNNLFGFRFNRKKDKNEETRTTSVVPSIDPSEGQAVVSSARFLSGAYSPYTTTQSQEELIKKYREMSMHPEIESAIDEITNEVFYIGDNEDPVNLVLDNLDYNDSIKNKIKDEFKNILTLLNFNENFYEYFKRWYIDGALYFNVVVDMDNIKDGIKDLRYIDAIKIKKMVEITKEKTIVNNIAIPDEYEEYFLYTDNYSNVVLKIPKDSIIYSTSGLTKISDSDPNLILNLSYLHKAIRPFNQLSALEDSAVVYRLARASEKRIFRIPVKNMPRHQQEAYLQEVIQKYRNKIFYDPSTGETKDSTRALSLLEDFWIPVPEGGTAADVTTLPGAQNLGEINDIKYFRNKLYNSLYLPLSRVSGISDEGASPSSYSIRTTEIIREEIKFAKFIHRLRQRFSKIFLQALKIQLILKGIVSLEEWENNIKNNIFFDFKKDSHFFEYNEAEIMTRRIELASAALQLEGFFSKEYIQKKFLKLTDEEIEQIKMDNKEISKKEKEEMESSSFSPFTSSTPIGREPLEEPGFGGETPEVPETSEPLEEPESPTGPSSPLQSPGTTTNTTGTEPPKERI